MLFLKSFLRTLIRHKTFTFINLFGLTFSLAFILLIGTYLLQEKGFDRFYKNIDQIYIVTDSAGTDPNVDYRIKQMLKDNLPEIQEAALYYKVSLHINYLDKVFNEDKIASVDNDFFKLFNVTFLKGNTQKPFNGLDEAIVSASLAGKIFGKEDPLGKRIIFNHEIPLTVVGVVQDFPANSSLQGNFFVNAENKKMHFSMSCNEMHKGDNPEDKCSIRFNIFVQLQKGTNLKELEKKTHSFMPHDIRFPSSIKFFPFKEFHLTRQISMWGVEQGNPGLLKILGGIVLIITLLALINYVNLTTAGYKLRLKETGVKKGLGAQRATIIREYILESVIMCLVAAYLSTFLASLLLPSFNNFLHTHLSISVFTNLKMFVLFFLLSLLLGILAGIYPALYLSMISPRDILASGVFTTRSGKPVRNILNIFQFTIAIILITVILFMQKQIRFAKHQDLGFKTEKLLRLDMMMQSAQTVKLLIDKLRPNPEILSLSPTCGVPANIQMHLDGHASIGIDSTFYETFGIDVIDGRRLLPGDIDKACLINETARKQYDDGKYQGKKINEAEIVGVVKDFNVASVHTKIEPLGLFSFSWMDPNNLTLRLRGGNIPELMDFIRKAWKEVCPDYPFQYNFYDEWFDSMYRGEEDLGKLISLFALLAIVISSMGILGLALFATEQRSKEIGVRKVNGATSGQIMFVLSRDFTKWILVSFLIGIPISYYAIDKWLANFAYHTNLSWWVFGLAGLIAFLVALVTVSFQSWKAASRNPVDALRYE
jgi:putative ABC transport system permease protein